MGKKLSKANKGTYATYRNLNVYSKNKKHKLERHLKKFPNDVTAKECYDSGIKVGFPYKRKTPNTPQWSHTDKHHAEVWASLGHHGQKYIDFMKKLKRTVTTKTTPAVSKGPNV
jgi:hypothetical protein